MALRRLVYECALPVPAAVRSTCTSRARALTLEQLFTHPGATRSHRRASRTTATWIDTLETLEPHAETAVEPFEIESYVLEYADVRS